MSNPIVERVFREGLGYLQRMEPPEQCRPEDHRWAPLLTPMPITEDAFVGQRWLCGERVIVPCQCECGYRHTRVE